MDDNDIIKALECCVDGKCYECPCSTEGYCKSIDKSEILDLINRQKAEIERLEHLLLGVMHFVDKWLDGAELKQDEVNRARAMREKTLQIVEKLEEENDFLKSIDIDRIKAEAVKEFAERLKTEARLRNHTNYGANKQAVSYNEGVIETRKFMLVCIDNLVKEMEVKQCTDQKKK